MQNKVIVVSEKWCDGSPDVGMTNNFHQLFRTFQQCKPTYNFNTIHIDESWVTYHEHIDKILPKYCLHHMPKIVFFCLLGDSHLNPSLDTYLELKELDIFLCFIWPDSATWAVDKMYKLNERSLANLHVSWDQPSSDYHTNMCRFKNLLKLWAPQDPSLYHLGFYNQTKDIDVSFVGSRYYPLRQDAVGYLQKNLESLVVVGGQREDKLSPEAYAAQIKNSKIVLNLPQHPAGFYQLKSRVLESIACGSLVIELKNPSTSQLFEPEKDYVAVESLDEMISKTRFYLNHPQERLAIVNSAYTKYIKNYTAQHYWDTIFNQYEKQTNRLL